MSIWPWYISKMILRSTARGYIRPLPRLTEAGQRVKLATAGCASIYVEGAGETLADAIAGLRRGDTLAVVWLHVLAPSRKSYRDRPRQALWAAVRAIEARGASILETETGRSSAVPAERDDMMQDAIEHLTSAGRAAAGRRNGRKSKGRPPVEYTEDVVERARGVWYDLRHDTNTAAVAAGPDGWTLSRYYRQFGPSGR